MPVTAMLGLAATSVIWIIILVTQPYSRSVGIIWMVVGLGIYYLYRKRLGVPLLSEAEEGKKSPK